eukprot:gene9233-1319_t
MFYPGIKISDADLAQEIHNAQETPPTLLNLQGLYDFGNTRSRFHLAEFIYKEFPIRIARQIRQIDQFPYGFCLMPTIQKIRAIHVETFKELLEHDFSAENEPEFYKLILKIKNRHSSFSNMERGLFHLKKELKDTLFAGSDISEFQDIHESIDAFYLRRIGYMVLLGQYINVYNSGEDENYVGIIDQNCSPNVVIQNAIAKAQFLCERYHSVYPQVTLHGIKDLTFPFLPGHLFKIVFELLKNSMHATVLFHGKDQPLPNIRVIVADGELFNDISIKVSDEGGGFPRSCLDKVWTYLYTTTEYDEDSLDDILYQPGLCGIGFGLPIAKNYSKYLGGSLNLLPLEGYGTDAYLYLNKLTDDNAELD